jgi:hypothetical protein
MKTILFLSIFAIILSIPQFPLSAEETDPGIRIPEQVAKEYMAEKYSCDIKDLTISDTLIGRRAAHIDVNYGYRGERVILRYNEAERKWEAEDSMPLHKY